MIIGFWASSLKGGKTIQRFQFGQHHPLNELHLQRFDLVSALRSFVCELCELCGIPRIPRR